MLSARKNIVNLIERRAVACFSSAVSAEDKKKYAQQRRAYKEQVHLLRKEWMIDHAEKIKAEEDSRRILKEKVVLETAIRLRERRIKKVANQATDKHFKSVALAQYRAKLAKHIVLKDLEHQRAEKRFRQLLADLKDESSTWITLENMEERIIPALFDAPSATTGLITRYSDHMRYYAHPDDYKRLVAEERAKGGIDEDGNIMPVETWKFDLNHQNYDATWDGRQAEIMQHRSADRLDLERNLNTLVGTAKEREIYQSLVRQYVEHAHVDDQALAQGRLERQERLLAEEQNRGSKIDDMIANAAMSGQNVDDLKALYPADLDQSRDVLVSRFKQSYPALPGALGPVYTSLRNHIGRLGCQEDFDSFLTSYVDFAELLKQTPDAKDIELVSDAELITNADYLDRLSERLHKMVDVAENSGDQSIPPNMQRLYASKLQAYREDWWKFQGLLVLSGRADECSLGEDFNDRLVHPSNDTDL